MDFVSFFRTAALKTFLPLKSSRHIAVVAFLTLVYFFTAKFGLSLASVNPSATAVWPPTGIAIAAVILIGFRVWPAIFLGAFFVNLTTAGTVWTSLGIALGNTLEAAIAVYLVNKYAGGEFAFEHPGNVFRFAVIAGIFSTAVATTVGVATLALGALAETAELGRIWLTWWLGDVGGALVLAPLFIIFMRSVRRDWNLRRIVDIFLLFSLLIAAAVVVFWGVLPGPWMNYPLSFLLIPPLIFIAFRLGRRETALAVVLLAFIATWGTLQGYGPFAVASAEGALLLLQIFLVAAALSGDMFAASVFQERSARKKVYLGERHFRSLIENSLDMILLVDRKGKIFYVSPSSRRFLGSAPDSLKGTFLEDLVSVQDREKVADIFSELVSRPNERTTFEMRVKCERDVELWLEAVAQNLLDDSAVEAVVFNLRDITEWKNLQTEKNRFIATISNRLRGPLSLMRTYLDAFLKKKNKLTLLEQRYLREIDRATRIMVTSVGDILRLMRIELGSIEAEPRLVDLKKAVESAVHETLPKAAPRGIVIERRYSGDRTFALVDPNVIISLANRLIMRAMSLSEDKSKIGVRLSRGRREASIEISYASNPGVRMTFVSLPHHLQSLWPVDRRSAEERGNITIEFYTLQSLAELLGGKIAFEPQKGGGAFTIILPLPEKKKR